MTGKNTLSFLKSVCDEIDLRSKASSLRRAAAIVAVPITMGFATACDGYMVPAYGSPYEEEICHNGIDDDYDGLTDCDDDECSSIELCLGCDDGIDNDGDGHADCRDSTCQLLGPCADEICGDRLDNDSDGTTDCDDEDCAELEICLRIYDVDGNLLAACSDGDDNDGDGLADCEDSSCKTGEACQVEGACEDYTDNDGDGLYDCNDPDCGWRPECN